MNPSGGYISQSVRLLAFGIAVLGFVALAEEHGQHGIWIDKNTGNQGKCEFSMTDDANLDKWLLKVHFHRNFPPVPGIPTPSTGPIVTAPSQEAPLNSTLVALEADEKTKFFQLLQGTLPSFDFLNLGFPFRAQVTTFNVKKEITLRPATSDMELELLERFELVFSLGGMEGRVDKLFLKREQFYPLKPKKSFEGSCDLQTS